MADSAPISALDLFRRAPGINANLNRVATEASAFSGELQGVGAALSKLRGGPWLMAITEAAKLGAAAVEATVDNARQRRTQGLAASGAGTTAQKIDLLTRRFESMGLTRTDAEKSLDEFSKVIDSSIDDTGKGPDELTSLGLSAVGDYGQRFDKATLLMRAQEKLADLYKRNDELRAKLAADKAAGKDIDQRDVEEVKANEKVASKASRKFGFDNKMIGGIRQSAGSGNMIRETNKASARRPPIDPGADALNIAIDKHAIAIDQMSGRIVDGFKEAGAKMLAPIIAAVESGMENTLDVGGRRRAEGAEAALRQALGVNDSSKKVPGMFHYRPEAMKKFSGQAEEDRKAYEKYKRDTREQADISQFGDLDPKNASSRGEKAATNVFGNLGAWTNGKWNDVPSSGAGHDALRTFGISGPVNNYHAGNDNSITNYHIGVTVGTGAPALANGVVGAIRSARDLGKATQLQTAGSAGK